MKIKLSQQDWEIIGQKTGWLKGAAKLEEGGPDMGDVFGDPETQEDSQGNIAPFAPVLGPNEGVLTWIESLDGGRLVDYVKSEWRTWVAVVMGEDKGMLGAMQILSRYPGLFWMAINWGVAQAMLDAERSNSQFSNPDSYYVQTMKTPQFPDWPYRDIVKKMPHMGLAERMDGDDGVAKKILDRLPPHTNREDMMILLTFLMEETEDDIVAYLKRIKEQESERGR